MVGVPNRPDLNAQLDAVRTGIAAALRLNLAGILREPLPVEMAELLRQLDQPQEGSHGDC